MTKLPWLLLPCLLHAQPEPPAYGYLRELCDTIGARLTGSPEEKKARQWALARMKEIGLENVHEETWQFPRAWKRGSARAELRTPVPMKLSIDSLGWAGSTPKGGKEAEVVAVNRNQLAAEVEKAGGWRGKILLLVSQGKDAGQLEIFGQMGNLLDAALRAGAIAVIAGEDPGANVPAGLVKIDSADPPRVFTSAVVVTMAPEHRAVLQRLLAAGQRPRLWIEVLNTMSKGHVESANVIGEIRGGEHPEEVVLLGAHIDSWDLGQGATDDGFGVAAVLGAAFEMKRQGKAPARTVRFALFSGEEQGVKGSRAYTKAHASELPRHVAALMSDMGDGPPAGLMLNGRSDLTPVLQDAARALALGDRFKIVEDPFIAGDSMPFTLAGVPAIDVIQESRDFAYTHHTVADTFDKVKPENVARQSALLRALATWIADRNERIGPTLSQDQTRQLVAKLQIGVVLRLLGFTD